MWLDCTRRACARRRGGGRDCGALTVHAGPADARVHMQSRKLRWFGVAAALVLGLSFGAACKDGGSSSPGSSGGGGGSCPAAVPRKGSKCQRGEGAFCVYRNTGKGDFLCSCGSNGKWGCGKK